MTAQQLIEKLQTLDPNTEILRESGKGYIWQVNDIQLQPYIRIFDGKPGSYPVKTGNPNTMFGETEKIGVKLI